MDWGAELVEEIRLKDALLQHTNKLINDIEAIQADLDIVRAAIESLRGTKCVKGGTVIGDPADLINKEVERLSK